MKRFVTMIKQDHLEFTCIIRVNNTGTGLNTILHSETRARSDATVAPGRNSSSNSSANNTPCEGRNLNIDDTVQVISNLSARSRSLGNDRVVRKPFDKQFRFHLC